jgi:decaprenylphospho-beta-D-erythro-pentofuranosid-2-ulose 2-reductase
VISYTAQKNFKAAQEIINTNYVGAVSILNVVANDFENRKRGTIVGISSVAGDRGRQSNYVYGSAKAGFTAFLSGLRNRLYHHGVHVLTVKPGFVKTQMIENLKTPAPITAIPKQVADRIFKAVRKKKDNIYVLPIWSMIMLVIKSIPEGIFKKLKL